MTENVAQAISSYASTAEPAFITIPLQDYKTLLAEMAEMKAKLEEHEFRINKHSESIYELKYGSDPTPAQQDKGKALRAILAANGGKMLAKEARKIMRLPENRFSELLASQSAHIKVERSKLDKRKKLLVLKSKLLPRKEEVI